jgi:hypothetical protein
LFTLPEKGGARRLCCQSEALLHYRWGIGKQNFYFFEFWGQISLLGQLEKSAGSRAGFGSVPDQR